MRTLYSSLLICLIVYTVGTLPSCSDMMGHYSSGDEPAIAQTQDPDNRLWIDTNNSYFFTRITTVHSSVAGAEEMRFSENGSSWSTWTAYAENSSITFLYTQGTHTLWGQYKKADGSIITLQTSGYYINKLFNQTGAANDSFGSTIAISSNGLRVASSAPYQTVGSTTMQGAVWIGDWDNVSWTTTLITPSDGVSGDMFGSSLDMSPDGSCIVVGSPFCTISGKAQQGAVYIYMKSGSAWTEYKKNISKRQCRRPTECMCTLLWEQLSRPYYMRRTNGNRRHKCQPGQSKHIQLEWQHMVRNSSYSDIKCCV